MNAKRGLSLYTEYMYYIRRYYYIRTYLQVLVLLLGIHVHTYPRPRVLVERAEIPIHQLADLRISAATALVCTLLDDGLILWFPLKLDLAPMGM